MNDSELLESYAESGSEAAFTELVTRHLNLVYSAALRQVGGDHPLAQEVAQSVFCDLARKAKELAGHQVLSGWLYTSTRFAAARMVRGEQRRVAREQQAYHMQESNTPTPAPGVDLQQLEAVLDEAMHELKQPEREAILLRFFERQQFAEVGAALGITTDAARMRVERAIEKLRGFLGKRGVTASSAALAAVLLQQGLAAAPAGLIASITAGAVASSVAGAALSASFTAAAAPQAAAGAQTLFTTIKIMGMTKLQAGAAALLIVGASVPFVLERQTNEELNARIRSLARQNEEITAQIAPLSAENARLSNWVARAAQNSGNNSSNELYRLRAEVTRLREEMTSPNRAKLPATVAAHDPMNATLQNLGARVSSLKQRLDQMPQTRIPELQYLKEKHWLDAVASLPQMESDEDYRRALNMLRASAKDEVGGQLQAAIHKYAEANDGMLPENLSQVQSLLEKPLDPAILDRYQMVGTGKLADLSKEQSVFEEIAVPVDDEYETFLRFHKNGRSSTSYSQVGFMLEAATEAYARANNGKLPRDHSQVAAYLQRPVDPERVQKFLGKIPPNVTTLAEMKKRLN